MTITTSKTKVELSAEESKTLSDAYLILTQIEDLLDYGYNTLFTNNIDWEHHDVQNAISLLDELANDEITVAQ